MASANTIENGSQVHMLTLECLEKDCLTRLRIGRFLQLPVTRQGGLVYCPICGGRANAHTDVDESYWETLAKAYELPVEAVKAVHSIWNPHEYTKFSDFVEVMKQEAAALTRKQAAVTNT